jgi:hypothetical protein
MSRSTHDVTGVAVGKEQHIVSRSCGTSSMSRERGAAEITVLTLEGGHFRPVVKDSLVVGRCECHCSRTSPELASCGVACLESA